MDEAKVGIGETTYCRSITGRLAHTLWRHVCSECTGPSERGWDLGPFAAALQCLSNKPLLEQQNAKKLYGTKNNCMHAQLGQNYGKKIQRDQKNPNCHFWRAWSKNRVLGAKAGYWACPLHSTPPEGWAKHLSHLSSQPPRYSLNVPFNPTSFLLLKDNYYLNFYTKHFIALLLKYPSLHNAVKAFYN